MTAAHITPAETQPAADSWIERTHTLPTTDGHYVFAREWWHPLVPPRYNLVISHGLGEHTGRYRHIAAAMVAHGAHVVAADHRGYGHSAGRRGYVPRFRRFVTDLDLPLNLARQRYPDLPVVLLGHSMGGIIAAAYAIQHHNHTTTPHHRVDALILSAPAFRLNDVTPPAQRILGLVMDRIWPTFTVYRPPDGQRLSRDPAVQEAVRTDPLFHGYVSARLFVDTFERSAEFCLRRASTIDLPCLMVHGLADPLVDIAGSRRFYASISSPVKHFLEYEGMRHEAFNEFGWPGVVGDVQQWLDSVLA